MVSKTHLTKEQRKTLKKLQKYYKNLSREERHTSLKVITGATIVALSIQEFIKGKD